MKMLTNSTRAPGASIPENYPIGNFSSGCQAWTFKEFSVI